ncbi:uncharacterized protein LOC130975673 [Arachis stenosperma]|uniref:uncharacterized protein LOC130975673 n=1 Tax=Arachis stenosperma TaxID=217475 RepID=UPI0025AD5ACF|nr:uncharacterized protein LOC130975673 [Arachis stenosperma]
MDLGCGIAYCREEIYWKIKEEETSEHALLLCDWTRAVWFSSQPQCIPLKENVKSIGDWLQQMYKNGKTAKNMQVYNYIEPNPELVINQERKLEQKYSSHTEEFNNKVMEPSIRSKVPVKWRPPPQDWLKLNTDAAFSDETKTGATAAVIRDYQGNMLGGIVNKIIARSTLSAEAQAIREAIILANNLGIQKATIEQSITSSNSQNKKYNLGGRSNNPGHQNNPKKNVKLWFYLDAS